MNKFPGYDSFVKCYRYGSKNIENDKNIDNNDNNDRLLQQSTFLVSKKVVDKTLSDQEIGTIVDNIYDKFSNVHDNVENKKRCHEFLVSRLLECSKKDEYSNNNK